MLYTSHGLHGRLTRQFYWVILAALGGGLLLLSGGCGRSGHNVPAVPGMQQPAPNPPGPGVPFSSGDPLLTNMNDRIKNPALVRVDQQMGPQQPLADDGKLPSVV